MKKADRLRLRNLVIDYIENTLDAEKYPEKVFFMYDYGIQTKYWLLRIALDRDHEGSELFILFCQFDEWYDAYQNPHISIHSNKYNLHILLDWRTPEDCIEFIKSHLDL